MGALPIPASYAHLRQVIASILNRNLRTGQREAEAAAEEILRKIEQCVFEQVCPPLA